MNIQETTGNWQIEFGQSRSIQQLAMLEYLNSISPKERTELLGEMYHQWEMLLNEQVLIGEKNGN